MLWVLLPNMADELLSVIEKWCAVISGIVTKNRNEWIKMSLKLLYAPLHMRVLLNTDQVLLYTCKTHMPI